MNDRAETWIECELCIVGAGFSALNGLNAAAKYLKKGERVVVIDKNATWGGQWLHQYEFLRLHQPYRMFTPGDQPWKMDREPWYLATRREVLDHLASVPAGSAGHLDITPLFGHAYAGHEVREGRVELVTKPVSNAHAAVSVRAKRLLLATGAEIEMLPPFALSSKRIRSLGVSDPVLSTPDFLASDAPVYIVGSGKTAMDCALHVIRHRNGKKRQVNVIAGSGMWYLVRDNLYARGARRYYGGVVNTHVFVTMSKLFDGQNETRVMEELERRGYVHTVWEDGGNCRVALLSLAEREELRVGVDQVYRGHLVDVEGPRMTVRRGQTFEEHKVPEEAYFINCTSHLRTDLLHQPLLQDSGLVCAPQSAVGLPGISAYFVTHLWMRGELGHLAPKLCRMRFDIEPKLRFVPLFTLMIMANLTMINDHLPPQIALRFQGDFNRWYPLYRRLPMMTEFVTNRRMFLEKAERLLKLRYCDSPDRTPSPELHGVDLLRGSAE